MKGKLTVIGCRAGSPGVNGPASGYVVETDAVKVLVDCGPGVLAGLTERGLHRDFDAVVISHRHADHSADLAPFGYHRCFPEVLPPIPLFAPTGFGEYADSLDQVHGIPTIPEMAAPIAAQFPLREIEPGTSFEVEGLRVDTIAAAHPVPCMSIRFPQLGLVYTADTGLTEELVTFSAGSKLLLAEATYPTEEGRDFSAHGHMGGAEVGRLTRRSGAEQLVVTHLSDIDLADETEMHARKEYEGPLVFAEPGQTFQLSS